MGKQKPIRFAVDTNVLISLAIAKFCSKEEFLAHHSWFGSRETIYNSTMWLQRMIDLHKIELVIPMVVRFEIITIDQVSSKQKKFLSKKDVAERKHKDIYKKLVMRYLEKSEGIKFMYSLPSGRAQAQKMRVTIAEHYSSWPTLPKNFEMSHLSRRSPFLLYSDGKPCQDALIVAEATMFGVDLISFDKHIVGSEPFNIPVTIQKINQQHLGSDARPYNFMNIINQLRAPNEDFEINPHFTAKKRRPLLGTLRLCTWPDYMLHKFGRYEPAHIEKKEKKFLARCESARIFLNKTLDEELWQK